MSEISRFHRTQVIIPREIRGYGKDEFIQFQYDPSLDASKFRVLVEDLAGRWVELGKLANKLFVPNTYWPNNAKLVVVGTNRFGQQVRFVGTLNRGALYVLGTSSAGDHGMKVFSQQTSEPHVGYQNLCGPQQTI